MATQEQINAARRVIERLRDQHANDVRKLIGLLESGAMKGKAADKFIEDCRGWQAAYNSVFSRALALIDSAPVSAESGAANPDTLARPQSHIRGMPY
ncbi:MULTISPECIES: hypothetical protein [unclassified Nonomuraea]|uniref:hypothetical protein n=1 Tax=unclassified Nonomuraea TaxID=2593643 RepID=UPI0033E7EE2C